MEPKRATHTASRKEAYWEWYEFALIAMNMTDLELEVMGINVSSARQAMKGSREFYKPWDLDKSLDAGEWWKSHSHLFEETQQVRLLKVGEKPLVPDALIIEVPLTLTPTKLKKAVGELILQERYKRRESDYEVISRPSAAYKLTPGKKIHVEAMRNLRVCIKTFLAHPNLKGKELLEKLVDAFEQRETGEFPKPFDFDKEDEDEVRNARGAMKDNYHKARNLLEKVLKGEFP